MKLTEEIKSQTWEKVNRVEIQIERSAARREISILQANLKFKLEQS